MGWPVKNSKPEILLIRIQAKGTLRERERGQTAIVLLNLKAESLFFSILTDLLLDRVRILDRKHGEDECGFREGENACGNGSR